MNKNAVLGELLYIISNYEKGRIKISGIWSKRYINSLKESLQIMKYILALLRDNRNISVQEMLPFFIYYKQNLHKIFSESDISIDELLKDDSKIIFYQINNEDECNNIIINFIEKIILECDLLIIHREKNYKIKLRCLFGALHNLPKVFLNKSEQTFFNLGLSAITTENAIEYANLNINLLEKYK